MASPKILLVEDNFITADEISDRLRQIGFSDVVTAFSGAGAVKLAETEQPDLILMDIHLGAGMDGIAAAAQIQADRRVPVIYLTAYDNDATLARARITDPSAYLIKPVRERELHIAIDIALYKQQAEAAIRQSEQRFRAVFEQAAAGMAIARLDERLIEVNQKLCDMLGYTRDELLQLTVPEITFSDDHEREMDETQAVRAGNQDSFNLEKRYRHKDGHAVWANLSSNVVRDEQGEIQYAVGVVVDITEQKQAEQALRDSEARLRMVLDNTEDIVYVQAPDGRYLYYNGSSAYGLSPEHVIGKTPYDFFDQDAADMILARLQHVIASGERLEEETRVTWQDETLWFLDEITPVRDADGRIIAISQLSRNITERKRAAQALRRSERELREANATKDRFFSIISHDLRNPMYAVESGARMLAERLQGVEEDEQTLMLARELHAAAERVSKLLENLLTWAQMQQGSVSYQPVATGLAARVRFCAGLAQQWAEQKQITICNRVPADLMVRADNHMLAAILRNLLSNAVKFTNPGGLVTIEAAPQDGMVEIAVTDTGVGMSQEKADSLFKLVQKVKAARGTAGERGTGLGLLLCREFVVKHGGRIWVKSAPGQGSTFRFTLPQAEAAASAKRNLTEIRDSTT